MNVSVFPLNRRRHLVEETAQGLSTHHGEDANRYWRQKAEVLLRELRDAGVGIDAARDEVRSLLHAALNELHRGARSDAAG